MKRAFVVSMFVMFAVLCVYAATQDSDLHKAFLHSRKYDPADWNRIDRMLDEINGAGSSQAARWARYRQDAKHCPAIAEVVRVEISKTIDTGNYVIMLIGPRGMIDPEDANADTCSLWIDGHNDQGQRMEVTGFTTY